MVKRSISLVIMLILALSLIISGCASDQPETQEPNQTSDGNTTAGDSFNLLFAGANPGGGGTWDLVGAGVSECVRREGGIVTLTPGEGVANPATVSGKQADMAFCQSVVVNAAIKGNEPYKESYPGIKAIAALYSSAAQILVPTDSGIESFEQIKEKQLPIRIAVDETGSTQELTMKRMLNFYGITYDDIKTWKGNVIYKGFGEATDLMLDNRVDVFGTLTIVPTSSVQEIATSKKLRMLNLDAVSDKMCNEFGYQPYTIEKGTYDFMTEDVTSFATQVLIIVNADMDDETAYRITKALAENIDYMKTVHNNLSGLTLESLADCSGVELHPGAEKYYKEAGAL
ncbi:MAG: TAXI family TRAP transporter solute-binding subunit [Dehalobacterium sp.]